MEPAELRKREPAELRNIEESEKLREHLEGQRKNSRADLAKFSDRLTTDPAYAMTWADDAFTAAGRIQVLSIAISALENGVSQDELMHEALKTFTRMARSPAASTSVPSNLTEQSVQKAWADLYDQLGGRL